MIRVDAFAPGDRAATVTARLLNKQGTKMADCRSRRRRRRAVPIDLPLASLAAGEYLLELRSAKATARHELVAFDVEVDQSSASFRGAEQTVMPADRTQLNCI